MDKKELDEQTA